MQQLENSIHGASPNSIPGTVSFFSHSGSLCENFLSIANCRSIVVNNTEPFDNQTNFSFEEFLKHVGEDDTVKCVSAYIEDIRNGKTFAEIMKKVTPDKPVILLKGGITESDLNVPGKLKISRAYCVFKGVVRQMGGVLVDTFEELMDVTMLAVTDHIPKGFRTGFVIAGNGLSVNSADVARYYDLSLPYFSESAQNRLFQKLQETNIFAANPEDYGFSGIDSDAMKHAITTMDQDDNIDLIIPNFVLGHLPGAPAIDLEPLVQYLKSLRKPIIPIVLNLRENNPEHERHKIQMIRKLRQAGFPVFRSIPEAANAISKIVTWKLRTDRN